MTKSFNILYNELEDPKNYSRERRRSSVNKEIYYPSRATIPPKPTTSYSTPSHHHHSTIDPVERMQFLRDMELAKEELAEFRKNMTGLLKQMDGISVDLYKSAYRVSEIEQDLTTTEEVNVNLQILLEKAVKTQKDSDIFATQAIRTMYSDLASVVYENSQLQDRLTTIETHQKEQQGNVYAMNQRMYEYTEMLEQARGTIHMLQEPRLVKMSSSTSTLSRTSDDEDEFSDRKPILKPQQGLKMLFHHSSGSQLGLSSIAPKKSP